MVDKIIHNKAFFVLFLFLKKLEQYLLLVINVTCAYIVAYFIIGKYFGSCNFQMKSLIFSYSKLIFKLNSYSTNHLGLPKIPQSVFITKPL